ncbi:MAG: Mov34/MPN/PAD-1 family protein [Candidatus Binatia bacterium]
MTDLKELIVTEAVCEQISSHAAEAFPEECCGVIVRHGRRDEVRRLNNIQNLKHAQDPENNPRDAKIAYAMDPKELMAILEATERSGGELKAFYHSHPNHDAYFSEEDKAGATPLGEPTYADSAQIVISIYNRKVKQIRAYAWDEQEKDFVEVPLKKTSS